MRKSIEEEFYETDEEVTDSQDEEPIAAASIGQVYRAQLHDGRDVAVKVQYPGVAAAVRADMQNLRLILRLMKRMAPGLDVNALAEEVRLRIFEELDYELEAQKQPWPCRIVRRHPDVLYDYVRDSIWWYTIDEEVTLTPEIATEVMIEASDPRSSHFRQMRHQDMRPEHLFGRRMEMLTLAVLGQLRARNNWHRIAREWMYEDEPVTELGRAEAAFYARTPA